MKCKCCGWTGYVLECRLHWNMNGSSRPYFQCLTASELVNPRGKTMRNKFVPGTRVKHITYGPSIVIDPAICLIPQPKRPFRPLDSDEFYIFPDEYKRVPHSYAWAPYVLSCPGEVELIEEKGLLIEFSEDEKTPVICPECFVTMEWVACALKCPKCWKVI